MENGKIYKKVNTLIQLDIDAVHAYEQAIRNIGIEEIRSRLTEYKEDHQRHVSELSSHVRSNGGEPPEFSPDFKGFLIQGFTALRSSTGTVGALKAMLMNEKLTNKKYSEAMEWDVPSEAMSIIQKNYSDEQRHLEFVQEKLQEIEPEETEISAWYQGVTDHIKRNPVTYSIAAGVGIGALIWYLAREKQGQL